MFDHRTEEQELVERRAEEYSPRQRQELTVRPVVTRRTQEEIERDFMQANLKAELERELDDAAAKAVDSLARYKFQMFGYWAAIWVHLNRISGQRRPSPFAEFVRAARGVRTDCDNLTDDLEEILGE